MERPTAEHLDGLLRIGEEAQSEVDVERWSNRVSGFLRSAVNPLEASEFLELKSENLFDQHAFRLGHVQGLIARFHDQTFISAGLGVNASPAQRDEAIRTATNSKRVFVVHGHDTAAKETVARFLTKIGLEAIVLHEQPSSGRTIIEKFEEYSGDIAFAVVLLTPDDVGSVAGSPQDLHSRARQNVILELGYFMGRLGRAHVCALHTGGVELPSDFQGILYIDLDPSGAWRTKLAQEFVQAQMPIELDGLLGI